jgi:tRNA G18 (ribose-2'-O)-methylase SpoU
MNIENQELFFIDSQDRCRYVITMDNLQPNIEQVTSLELPDLQPYRTLRQPVEHLKRGIFIAEGKNVVQKLLASQIEIVSLLMTPEWYNEYLTWGYPIVSPQVKIFLAEKHLLQTIVGCNLHQGIMAVAKTPKEQQLSEIVRRLKSPFLFVALDGLVNAENVGVILRNCAAFGVDAVISGETSSSPYLRRAVRNSIGAVFTLQIIHSKNLIDDLIVLREKYNTKIIAAHPHEQLSIYDCEFSGNVCVVLGNEGDGISHNVLTACTNAAAIPMLNETDSLNVANASAVFLYEARRQRSRTLSG